MVVRFPSLVLCATLLSAACTEQRSRTVERGSAATNTYQELLERSRSRQTTESLILSIKKGIADYQREIGGIPTNMAELVLRGYLDEIPAPPTGYDFIYDPATGNVAIMPQQPGMVAPPGR